MEAEQRIDGDPEGRGEGAYGKRVLVGGVVYSNRVGERTANSDDLIFYPNSILRTFVIVRRIQRKPAQST